MISWTPYFEGFVMSAGLIIAIGAQNAFVLRQGLKGEHVFAAAAVCAACDVGLIGIGVAGMGAIIGDRPALLSIVTWGGAAFLVAYGVRSLHAAWRGGGAFDGDAPSSDAPEAAMSSASTFDRALPAPGLRAALVAALALSLLNPHVYLDTVLLLGGIGGRLPMPDRAIFAAGAISASITWFFGLAYGASALAPVFRRQEAWRVLDLIIGCVMLGIAFALGNGALSR